MQKKITFTLGLFLIIGLLSIISCQKSEPITIQEPEIPVTPEVEETYEIVPTIKTQLKTVSIHEQSLSGVIAVKDVLNTIITQSAYHPQLWGLQSGGIAIERADCPTLPSPDCGGTFPCAFTLSFDNCTPELGGSTQNQPVAIDGDIDLNFTDPVLTNGTSTAVTLSNGFKIGDYAITDSDGGTVDFALEAFNNGTRLRIDLDSDIIVTDGAGNTTTYANTDDFGNINLTAVDPSNNDDPDNPLTYIENEFRLLVKENSVVCQPVGGGTATMLTIEGDASQRLKLLPFECGCIKDGTIDVTIAGSTIVYDFGSSMTGGSAGACDGYVLDTTTPGAVPVAMQSCN